MFKWKIKYPNCSKGFDDTFLFLRLCDFKQRITKKNHFKKWDDYTKYVLKNVHKQRMSFGLIYLS